MIHTISYYISIDVDFEPFHLHAQTKNKQHIIIDSIVKKKIVHSKIVFNDARIVFMRMMHLKQSRKWNKRERKSILQTNIKESQFSATLSQWNKTTTAIVLNWNSYYFASFFFFNAMRKNKNTFRFVFIQLVAHIDAI